MTSAYAELHCHSNYSFLEGASHPDELVARARDLEMPALAITDRHGFYGAVKFFGAAQRAGIQPIIGTELTIDDGTRPPKDRVDYDRWGDRLLLLVEDKLGYTSLCRLISMAQMPNAKGMARLPADQLAPLTGHLIALVADPKERLPFYQEIFGRDRVFIELHDHLAPDDRSRNQALLDLAERHGAPLVITNEVFYATPERHRLHDVLTAIRHRTTLDEAQRYLHPNAEHYLKSGTELRQVFSRYPRSVVDEGLAHAAEIAGRCRFSFDLVSARFPGFPVPAGETPYSFLYRLCQDAVREKYHPVTSEVAARLQKELDVINKTGFSEFFLINWDLMRFARSRGIPGQGRGSAADSIVAYLLGITRVDPIEHNLLFERFLHEEMTTTPDIDIDFSTAHREQVIQYVYEKYGPERTGMVCNVVTYRQRSAIREVGKALGFKEETIDHLAKSASAWHPESPETIAQAAGYPTANPTKPWQQLFDLATQILDFPRHLSIHVGGMLVTGEPLIDIVPVERATMPGRMVVQFNKDDVEELGLIKMDMLGLRMLSVVAEALDLIEADTGVRPDLDALDLKDPEVYELCKEADTIGVFQIESRAQMQTLPRSRPESFNDLVVEVAIIRPGPIQGDAVQPYIRRKQGREQVTYAHPLLEPILEDTLGVILYQEQIIEIAMRVAGMTPSGADGFRRAMTRHLNHVEMSSLEGDFIEGCLANEVPREVADMLFAAVQGFAVYGFCRSHAAAFARTAYETAWLKLNHAVEFGCGLLNNQPMGFYHPSVLVEDLKRHGVTVLPVDVNRSDIRCLPEPLGAADENRKTPARPSLLSGFLPQPADLRPADQNFETLTTLPAKNTHAMRIGFNYVRDLGEDGRKAIVAERANGGAYTSFDIFIDRLRGGPIGPRAVRNLVMVGAFDGLGHTRRELLWGWQERWHGHGLRKGIQSQSELKLKAAAPNLPELDDFDINQLEYRISDLSTGHHLIHFCRDRLKQLGALESNKLPSIPTGERVRVPGLA